MEDIGVRIASRELKILMFFCTLIFVFLIIILICVFNCTAETITVDDDGEADFDEVRSAVDHASPGDTIIIKSGWYYGRITINKTLSLIGENPKEVYFYGYYQNRTILIESDYVNISNLHIYGNLVGVEIAHFDHCNISNNFITESKHYYGESSGLKLTDSHNNTIYNNTFYKNYDSALYLLNSQDNEIMRNIFSYNENHILSEKSLSNMIYNNTFYNHEYHAVNITDGSELDARNNFWFSNDEGEISTMMNGNVDFQNWHNFDFNYNRPPVQVKEIPSNLSIQENNVSYRFIHLSEYFDDEFSFIDYEVVHNSEPSFVHLDAVGNYLRIDVRSSMTSHKWHGTVKVVVAAKDILDTNTSSNLFTITVVDINEEPVIEDVFVWYEVSGGSSRRYTYNPYYLEEGDKMVFKLLVFDDNKIVRVEAKKDEGSWETIYENFSEGHYEDSLYCYYNWTVPRNSGGNHTFSFRAYDGQNYTDVWVEEIEVVYLGNKITAGDVAFIFALFGGIAAAIIIVMIVIAFIVGKRNLKKQD
jgi:parallel beta-helix repeat protein